MTHFQFKCVFSKGFFHCNRVNHKIFSPQLLLINRQVPGYQAATLADFLTENCLSYYLSFRSKIYCLFRLSCTSKTKECGGLRDISLDKMSSSIFLSCSTLQLLRNLL